MNSFQKWAISKLQDAGVKATLTGNWISVDGEPIMSVDGVCKYLRNLSAKAA